MTKKFYIIAIPARLNSKRLPGKVMEIIGKETMLSLVMKQCINIPRINKVFLCTDNNLISNEANKYPIDVILKEGNYSSGTDRIYNSIPEIIKKLKLTNNNLKDSYIINIQADQPFIDKSLIAEFIKNIELMGNPEILTSYYKKKFKISNDSSDEVKLVISEKSKKVLYFSRSIIPYSKENNISRNPSPFYLKYHIGVYAYRFDILSSWHKLTSSQLEKSESLEQLRWLDNDIPIYAFEYGSEVLSIDNISQLEYARTSASKLIK